MPELSLSGVFRIRAKLLNYIMRSCYVEGYYNGSWKGKEVISTNDGTKSFDEESGFPERLKFYFQHRTKIPAGDKQWSDVADYGDLFTLKDFIGMCEAGGFINYDGRGNYVFEGRQYNGFTVVPSDIKNGMICQGFTHVIWFNR